MKRAVLARILGRSGLRFLLSGTIPWSGVVVLTYHRIGESEGSPFDHGLWSATPECFAEQVRLCKRHLDVIAPGDLPDVVARGRGRYGMITFDDGYRDNHETAFPILRAERVPATFFVTTGFVDAPRVPWWDEIAWMVRTSGRDKAELPGWLPVPVAFDEPDREAAIRLLLRAYKAMPAASTDRFLDDIADATGSGRSGPALGRDLWMTWDMVRELRAAGMTIGGHTVSHPVLARAPPSRQREEIRRCGSRLAAEIGEPMRYFSYPVGGRDAFDAITRDCLRQAGVRQAFSYYGGFRRFDDWDDYDVRRVAVETYVTGDWFRSMVTLPRLFA